ncbi:MAG: hypothetical protein ABR861_10765 [Terriglobales bacterium]|jgi:hypothetical protein
MASTVGRVPRGLVFFLDLEWPALEASEYLVAEVFTAAEVFTQVADSAAVGEATANVERLKTCGALQH